MAIRQRVSLYFVRDGKLLLIYRWKNGRSFHVLPGGGVEPGETLVQAAHREAKEETNFDIELGPLLWHREADAINEEFAYLIANFQGELRLGGPEAVEQSPTNIYRFDWISLEEIGHFSIWPGPIHVDVLQNALF